MADLAAFLAGDLPDHVALFLADSSVDDADTLAEHGERVDGGVALVVPGEQGRSAFSTATGRDAMAFAKEASGQSGTVAPDLSGGDCPADDGDGDHDPRFVFAFVEAQNEAVGGLYAEGDVVHAYAACECGESYSQKWLAGERPA